MKGFRLGALLGAVVCSFPSAAIAQTSATDNAYLNDLYSFLQSQDGFTYTMATQSMSAEENVWAAQTFCEAFATGVDPKVAYEAYTTGAISYGQSYYDEESVQELAYAIGLYGGAVMNLGSTHYCPQYNAQVQQALNSLR